MSLRACAAVSFGIAMASGKKSGEGFSTLQSLKRWVEVAAHDHEGEAMKEEALLQGGARSASFAQISVAQKMEKRMGDAVKSIINLHDPEVMARLEDTLIPMIENQTTLMKQAIKDEQAEDQNLIDSANAKIAQCNTDRHTRFTEADGVDERHADLYGDRVEHTSCRGREVIAADQRKTDCDAAQLKSDTAVSETPDCTQQITVGSDMNAVDECLGEVDDWLNIHQSVLDDAIVKCNASHDRWVANATLCDTAQNEFENQHCSYQEKLNFTCGTLDTCYSQAFAERDDEEIKVKAKETSHNELWQALCRIHCFVDLFVQANTSNLELDDHDACLAEDAPCAIGDLGHINYTVPDDKDVCDNSTGWWNTSAYTALNQTFLETPIECVQELGA